MSQSLQDLIKSKSSPNVDGISMGEVGYPTKIEPESYIIETITGAMVGTGMREIYKFTTPLERKYIHEEEQKFRFYEEKIRELKNQIKKLNSRLQGKKKLKKSFFKKFKKQFIKEIEASKDILNLNDDWDGMGSKGYKKKTYEKMYKFLEDIAKEFYVKNKLLLHPPYIDPGMNSSIDLHWKVDKFELLISIPESDDDPISFYGDDYNYNVIKGTLDLERFEVLLSWMRMFH